MQKYDIRLAIHNHGPGDRIFPTPDLAYEKIKDLDRRVGLCIDIGHTVRIGGDPYRAAEQFADRLFDIHMKDVTAAKPEGKEIECGRGMIDIPRFLRVLDKVQYAGYVSFEHENDDKDPLPGRGRIGGLRPRRDGGDLSHRGVRRTGIPACPSRQTRMSALLKIVSMGHPKKSATSQIEAARAFSRLFRVLYVADLLRWAIPGEVAHIDSRAQRGIGLPVERPDLGVRRDGRISHRGFSNVGNPLTRPAWRMLDATRRFASGAGRHGSLVQPRGAWLDNPAVAAALCRHASTRIESNGFCSGSRDSFVLNRSRVNRVAHSSKTMLSPTAALEYKVDQVLHAQIKDLQSPLPEEAAPSGL